jgi:anti-anti-sigma factor
MRVPFRRIRPAAKQTGWPQADTSRGFPVGVSGERESIEDQAPDELAVQHVERGGRQTLLLTGALALDSVQTLEAAVRELRPEMTTAITLDLRGLEFIDSSGLWAITTVRKWCTQAMIGFSIIPGPEPVQNVFELTGLSDLLPFETSGAPDERPTSWE